MKVTGFNHLSIGTKNLAESVKFYETVLGMQTIPSYNFGFKTKYLRCGDLQLHIFELEDQVPFYQHFAVDVDDFHAAYDAAKAIGALELDGVSQSGERTSGWLRPDVFAGPSGKSDRDRLA